ncbi:MAG: sigma 54-interacting transcriptional regulator [Gammaproteobacteria bacterium]|nr:sigma 54-interacting transcriptional regulator [Gammaproteobacteria bacterium]
MSNKRNKVPNLYKLGQDGLRYDEGYPDIEDISRHLRFEASTGSVWQNDQKVMVLPVSIYESLRVKLIESLGHDDARKVYTTEGYEMGQIDAMRSQKLRGGNLHSLIAAGPQLLALKGIGMVDPLAFKVDIEGGIINIEAEAIGSVEADAFINNYGVGDAPACWFIAGHASGFFSWIMRKPVLFREVECRAIGHSRCRLIGKPLDEYENAETDVKYYNHPDFLHYIPKKTSGPTLQKWQSNKDLLALETDSIKQDSGASPGFKVVMQKVRKVAKTNATVLFIGRTGVGKEVFAQALHSLSDRSEKPIIAVNCAAIPDDLLESELFGVERGAYTGATESRPGRFERADGGTLFLDEITSLTLPAQGKLLRILQDGEVERLGSTSTTKVDVRVIAATNVDLRDEVDNRRFREDLFYRLNIFPIHIPPLRSRLEDIPQLMTEFLKKYSSRHNKSPAGFTEEAVEALLSYSWPGNIRELENMIERAVILVENDGLIHTNHLFTSGEHLPEDIFSVNRQGKLSSSSFHDINWDELARSALEVEESTPLLNFENALIKVAVDKAGGNISSAAATLGMTRGQLDYRLKKIKKLVLTKTTR